MNRNIKEFVNHNADLRSSRDVYGPEHVVILLAHYNGGAYLAEQLASIAAQTHRDWSVIISDDGSSEDWLDAVVEFARPSSDHRVWLVNGPGQGFARNFLGLITIAGPTVPYAAFCDQDDVWLPGKLSRAIKALKDVPEDLPALYCGRTIICDASLGRLHPSPLFSASPGFRNALVQNIGGGNTMVLNRAALDLLQDTARHAEGIVSHDWWAYQLISGAGGRVIYDHEPCLLYRQHGGNRIGANTSFHARLRRTGRLLQGQFSAWNKAQSEALSKARHWLTPEARTILDQFETVRNAPLHRRLIALKKSGIYRQTLKGQISLWIAAAIKRL